MTVFYDQATYTDGIPMRFQIFSLMTMFSTDMKKSETQTNNTRSAGELYVAASVFHTESELYFSTFVSICFYTTDRLERRTSVQWSLPFSDSSHGFHDASQQ